MTISQTGDFLFFFGQNGGRCHLGFLKFRLFNGRKGHHYHPHYHQLEVCMRMEIWVPWFRVIPMGIEMEII